MTAGNFHLGHLIDFFDLSPHGIKAGFLKIVCKIDSGALAIGSLVSPDKLEADETGNKADHRDYDENFNRRYAGRVAEFLVVRGAFISDIQSTCVIRLTSP